jgi:DNA-binding MarR family transcriptional regulator
MADVVDEFIEQWRVERPDLRLDAMASIGRLGRVMGLGTRVIEATLQRHDLRLSDFDVLATLRRLGPPYVATPSRVTQSLMLSPATLTSRLDRLENIGLIERRADPDDRRSLLVALTTAGFDRIDAAVTDHVQTEEQILGVLSAKQRRSLDDALTTLLQSLESEPGSGGRASSHHD